MSTSMISLDTSSTSTGYALFVDGSLVDHGTFKTPKKLEGEKKIEWMCSSIISYLKANTPDIVIVEKTAVDRNIKTLRILSEIVGCVRGASYTIQSEFWEYAPSEWRKLCTEPFESSNVPANKRDDWKRWSKERVKSLFALEVNDDCADAILLGLAHINQFNEQELY